jgi:hypothetical protein
LAIATPLKILNCFVVKYRSCAHWEIVPSNAETQQAYVRVWHDQLAFRLVS